MPSSEQDKMKKANKRGSHVGIILSFIIFMTFIFFIFIIVAPKVKTDGKSSFLEHLAQNVAENTSSNLTSISIFTSGVGSCFRISGFFTETSAGGNFVVKNEAGKTLQSSKDGSDLLLVRENTETFFKFLESEEFSAGSQGTLGSCTALTKGSGYTLGLMKTERKIFESNVEELIIAYENDYNTVKEDLKVSRTEDFSFALEYDNGTRLFPKSANTSILQNVNVYSDNFPIIYVNNNFETKSGFLGVSLWGG
jgi:hypothetical protein